MASARALAAQVAANPFLSAGGAGLLFLTSLVLLITLTGDPKAGVPLVRLSLAPAAAKGGALPGWREGLAPEPTGEAPLVTDVIDLSTGALPGDLAPVSGQAVITLPGGGMSAAADPALSVGVNSPLAPAPIAGLFQPGPGGGLLPIVGANGLTPAQAYARPFTADGRPRVALIVSGLGLNAANTRRAIEELPPEITLSFYPYAEGLQAWIDMARANGHEVLLEVPMEPPDYPANDPGPYTLLSTGSASEITKQLDWVLSRATGYFGLTNYQGGRFMAQPAAMTTFASQLKQRGLGFIDDGKGARRGMGPPRASADRIVDEDMSAASTGQQLAALEDMARSGGQALGSGLCFPVTIDVAKTWARTLGQRGFQLAPASALMKR
ncbi:polysaccharide deacetylase 2 family uncharacterized protein YibQ [Caulobacter ginsengisoli]|uniref:Polysaccharide deacetylase 2 family uncharacterized protein YibQ n=1 Tax=Caulobacter ginsengisoli TaxID=400775 RepID=A0ABU0IZB1_9CAUL|nr:divergent polysaccharide deacetylase family protein [Caulobacter ginsengisoli]MDQ0466307.1 polysaccharide deacetylase 2 family uncharacterized protein YibQ [Caulobacter ginsengisoli]